MLTIEPEHIRELVTLHGENVLVPMPCEHPPAGSLWVISTSNKHYDGAHTVYATSVQVAEMVRDEDFNADDELTEAAISRIRDQIKAEGRSEAIESAKSMPHPDGYTARVMDEMSRPGTYE